MAASCDSLYMLDSACINVSDQPSSSNSSARRCDGRSEPNEELALLFQHARPSPGRTSGCVPGGVLGMKRAFSSQSGLAVCAAIAALTRSPLEPAKAYERVVAHEQPHAVARRTRGSHRQHGRADGKRERPQPCMAVAALVAAAAAAATGGVGIDVAEEQHVVATDLLLAARLVGAGAQHPGKPDLTRLSRALAHRQQLGLHADHQNASHQGLRLGIGVRAGVRAGVDGVRGGGGRRLRFTCNRRCGLHLVERREQGEILPRRASGTRAHVQARTHKDASKHTETNVRELWLRQEPLTPLPNATSHRQPQPAPCPTREHLSKRESACTSGGPGAATPLLPQPRPSLPSSPPPRRRRRCCRRRRPERKRSARHGAYTARFGCLQTPGAPSPCPGSRSEGRSAPSRAHGRATCRHSAARYSRHDRAFLGLPAPPSTRTGRAPRARARPPASTIRAELRVAELDDQRVVRVSDRKEGKAPGPGPCRTAGQMLVKDGGPGMTGMVDACGQSVRFGYKCLAVRLPTLHLAPRHIALTGSKLGHVDWASRTI
eukprot:5345037-Pleurochrysis_carterae.AAC.2